MLNHHQPCGHCGTTNMSGQKLPSTTVVTPLRSQVSLGTEYTPPHLRMKNGSPAKAMVPCKNAIVESVHSLVLTHSDINSRRVSSVEPSTTVSAHLTSLNNPLVTDGNVDDPSTNYITTRAIQRESTPPPSPKIIEIQMSTNTERFPLDSNGCVTSFKPLFIAELPELSEIKRSKIPTKPVTFAPDFLRNSLGGMLWSPGYVFVPPPQMSILPGRGYFAVDPAHDPHLPSGPGHHGAKLVPFFNVAPEDAFDLPDEFDSSVDVPLFVLRDIADHSGKTRKRYVYYGHYTQSRWSDRLDYDHMVKCVPSSVREYWARELSAVGRPEWVTDSLQKHFFPAPEYEGTLPGYLEDEGGSITDGDLAAREEKVAKDLKRYAEKLRRWRKDSDMRTSMIREDFILGAFEKVISLHCSPCVET